MDQTRFELDAALRCPRRRTPLRRDGDFLLSAAGDRYPVVDGVPVLLPEGGDPTFWVIEASRRAAQAPAQGGFYEETIGILPEHLPALRARLAAHRERPEAVDPIISFLIVATAGLMYTEQRGRLNTVPIPELRLPPGDGRLLLDIGCGWGRWSIAAAKAGYRVVGVDPSLGAVLAAKRLAESLGLDAQFLVADALTLPLAPAQFDVIFSYSVLQHFSPEHATQAIREAAGVAKPGARLLIQMAHRYGARSLYHQARRGFREARNLEVRYYAPGRLLALFEDNFGPSTLSVDGFFGLGIQPTDWRLFPPWKRAVVTASQTLRAMANIVPPLKYAADSLYVTAIRRPAVFS